MEIRHPTHPDELHRLSTEELRSHYVVENLFAGGEVTAVYSHHDRMMIGGVRPAPGSAVSLPAFDPLRAEFFLQRRELGIVNVGGSGTVVADGEAYELGHAECLYVGKGTRDVTFHAPQDGPAPAFYLVSASAHETHPTRKAGTGDVEVTELGSAEGANVRTIRRYIHAGGIRSCQLVLGVTTLAPGSLWNTMPCHTHDRRTEVYLYFDLDPEHRIIHLMGRPDATRNLVLANEQAVIAPSWSVHCGVGTRNYSFVWAMAGENQAFEDMDHVPITALR